MLDNHSIDKLIRLGIECLIQSEAKEMPGRILGTREKSLLRKYYYEIIFGKIVSLPSPEHPKENFVS